MAESRFYDKLEEMRKEAAELQDLEPDEVFRTGTGYSNELSKVSFTPIRDDMTGSLDYETSKQNPDNVIHPSHYTQNSEIECIDAIKASMTPESFAGYCKGNCLKYIWRYDGKNGVEDLEKAKVYLTWLINTLKGEKLTK